MWAASYAEACLVSTHCSIHRHIGSGLQLPLSIWEGSPCHSIRAISQLMTIYR